MNTHKLISSAVAVGSLAFMAAGAQAQQGMFSFNSVFTPNPVTTNDGSSFITIVNGGNSLVDAGQFGSTQINLANLTETSPLPKGSSANFSQNISLALTITPVGDGPLTQTFTGTFSGQFNNDATLTKVVFDMPGSQTFDFTSKGLGVYTVNALTFVAPGSQSAKTLGSFGATVNFRPSPSTVPEPATVVPFALGGLALLGLIARKTRRTNGAAA